jgi:2-polyprenyl-3-methyl-5-hydroxy-6-metoxy-1,4-benzoquinol methylase
MDFRKSLIRTLIPEPVGRLLDVGSGPLFPHYAYADRAKSIVCVDWNMVKIGDVPAHVEGLSGDFVELRLPKNFDVVIAADVFEHIQVEDEVAFIEKCVSSLRPGGKLIISVPHKGTFAWLDPYEVKPFRDRILAKLGLFEGVHNGSCDIRKGHKHYRADELRALFAGLKLEQVRYFGYLFDPLLTWAYAVLGEQSKSPVVKWLERRAQAEFQRPYGDKAFNVVAVFTKPTSQAAS